MAIAPVFVVNGLKREELIAANSMIIHELYFDGLGGEGDPGGRPRRGHRRAISAASRAGRRSSPPWAARSAADRDGCC